jgi:FkbM family methyltransferase
MVSERLWFEPDPRSIQQIKEHFAGLSNVTLHEVAIFDREGELELVQREASTFVSELTASPAIQNDGYKVAEKDKFVVRACLSIESTMAASICSV